MRFPPHRALAAGILLILASGLLPAQTPKKTSTPSKQASAKSATSKGSRRHSRRTSWKRHGQQGIQTQRIREIQEALIREHYLTGEATGVWDARSKTAMTRYQAENGWQSKVVPDSRALIKLGLGPNYSDKDLYKSTSSASTPATATGSRQ